MPARVTVRYWAGAKRAAGRAEEDFELDTLADLRAALHARPELAAVSGIASFLVDGTQVPDSTPLRDGAHVDVLPPFAGGAGAGGAGGCGAPCPAQPPARTARPQPRA